MHVLTNKRAALAGSRQEVFRAMFEQASFGVVQVALNGRWQAVNQRLCDILGRPRSELLSKAVEGPTWINDFRTQLTQCNKLLRGDTPSFTTQKSYVRADGHLLCLKTTVLVLREEASGKPESYLAFVEDVTEEEASGLQARWERENTLRALAENLSDVFFILDADLRCTYWNKAAENLTGLACSETIGKRITAVIRPISGSAPVEEFFQWVRVGRHTRSGNLGCVVRGNDFVLEVTAIPSGDSLLVVAKPSKVHSIKRKGRVVIAHRDARLAEACKNQLQSEFQVLDVVDQGESLLRSMCELKPDLVVLDVVPQRSNEVDFAEQIAEKLPDTKLVFVSMNSASEVAAATFGRGASAYVLGASVEEEVLVAIRAVLQGDTYISPSIKARVETLLDGADSQAQRKQITDRQNEILKLLMEGLTMKEVANLLDLKPCTVAFHKYRMMGALGLKTNAQLLQYAMKKQMASS